MITENIRQAYQSLKTLIRGAYQEQKLRVQTGNRIIAIFKIKFGQLPSEKEDTMTEEGKNLLLKVRNSYDKLMDGLDTLMTLKQFEGDEVISSYTEMCLIDQYVVLEKNEALHFKRLKSILTEFPIYTEFLEKVKGVGPAMAGVIISEFDIHKAEYPSSLHKYAGLDVVIEDGKGRSRRKEHLIDVSYTNKNGKEALKKSITFNPFIKTKLIGVLGGSFLKVKESPYKDIYYAYKNRLENSPKYKDVGIVADDKGKKGHRHNMAIRYMIKMFLIDLHREWRAIEGLKPSEPYHVAKLGITHKVA